MGLLTVSNRNSFVNRGHKILKTRSENMQYEKASTSSTQGHLASTLEIRTVDKEDFEEDFDLHYVLNEENTAFLISKGKSSPSSPSIKSRLMTNPNNHQEKAKVVINACYCILTLLQFECALSRKENS